MVKTSLYGKTKRFNDEKITYIISEKIDGANLGIGKYEGRLYVATRNQVFNDTEFDKLTYGGLKGYIEEHHDKLVTDLKEGVIVFGEWVGEIKAKNDFWKYHDRYNSKFIIFAQAKFKGSSIENRSNNVGTLPYAFENDVIPNYLPVVEHFIERADELMTIERLDELYDDFIWSWKEGKKFGCEGFVVWDSLTQGIKKYVRQNRKKEIVPHKKEGGK